MNTLISLKQLKRKKHIKAMISLQIGKYRTLTGYLCRIVDYKAPDGSCATLPIINCNKTTGEPPKIYTSFDSLKSDYDKIKAFKPRIISCERKING